MNAQQSEQHEMLGLPEEALRALENAALMHIQDAFPAYRDGWSASRTDYGTPYLSFAHVKARLEGEEAKGINLPPGFSRDDAFDAINLAYEVFTRSFVRFAQDRYKNDQDLVWRLKPRFVVFNRDDGVFTPPRPDSPIVVYMRTRFCFERPLPTNPAGPLICVHRSADGDCNGPVERVWGGVDELSYLQAEEIEDLGEDRAAVILSHVKASEHWHLEVSTGHWQNSSVVKVMRDQPVATVENEKSFFPDRIGRIGTIGRY